MKRSITFLTVLSGLALAGPCSAQELGRLFFTPEQRAQLDARRRARVPDKPAAVPVVASPTTRLDGYVKRSRGTSTVWVNGQALPEGPGQAPRIESGRSSQGRVAVSVGDSGARVGLKPGEILDLGSGEIRDLIGGGTLDVPPKRP